MPNSRDTVEEKVSHADAESGRAVAALLIVTDMEEQRVVWEGGGGVDVDGGALLGCEGSSGGELFGGGVRGGGKLGCDGGGGDEEAVAGVVGGGEGRHERARRLEESYMDNKKGDLPHLVARRIKSPQLRPKMLAMTLTRTASEELAKLLRKWDKSAEVSATAEAVMVWVL